MILTCYCRRTYYRGATVSEYRERHQEFPITVDLPITMVLLFQSIVNDIKNSLLCRPTYYHGARNNCLKVPIMILTCYCRRTYYRGATVSEYREQQQEFPITVGLHITMVLGTAV